MSEYLVSAKIIEFFWLLLYFCLFILAAIIKFSVKKEIHQDQKRSDIYNQQRQDTQQQMHPHSSDPEQDKINVVANPIHVDIQVKNSISAELNEKTKSEKMFDVVNDLGNYLPVLAIVILCVNNFASYTFAMVAQILYIVSTILFVEMQIQQNMPRSIGVILKYSNQIWIIALFINYLVSDYQNQY